jgi:2,4-diaminopentanoate dehydrogenase
MAEGRRYRVVQWATGNIGTRSLRAVIEHPQMDLVGLYVSSPDKAGKDAGELCGLPPVGVRATSSVDEIVALDADCVLYMRQGTDVGELEALLASGKNVVTTRGDFHHPPSMDPDLRSRIEAACATGGTSIHSIGSSPGFVTETLPLALLLMSRRLDCLTIDEFADMSSRNSPDLLFNVMGYGAPLAAFDQRKVDYVKHDFAGSLAQIADAIGLPCERFEAVGEYSGASRRTEIAAGAIEAGTVAAQRITITGIHNGKPLLRWRANWYCSRDIEAAEWDLRESGWRVQVEGDTPLDVTITFPVSEEDYPRVTPGFTAHPAVNAVPVVCEAAPGIRTTVDLPRIVPQF